MDEQPQLLTVKEASKELGLALTTVYAMMNTGAVEFVVIRKTRRGLNRRIPRSEIERLKPLYEIPTQEQKHDANHDHSNDEGRSG